MNIPKKQLDPKDFFKYLKTQVNNQSIYLWGAQGQDVVDLTIGDIVSQETSKENVSKVLNHLAALESTKAFDPFKAKAFDCSGLGTYFIVDLHGIYNWDHNAEAWRQECVEIPEQYRQPGDFVFSAFSSEGKAGHIGYIDEDGTVVEARGRAYGVVRRMFSAGAWNKVGRPVFWKYTMQRELKNGSVGSDVGQLQARLIAYGYDCGNVDNDFGKKTENALIAFQKKKKLKNLGVMDEKTATALGFATSFIK